VTGALRIVYRSGLDATPEQARDARARAWAFVFQCWQEKKMAAERSLPDGRDDAAMVTEKERGGGVDRGKETKKRSYQGATKGRQ
jgi:hypothetical protein